jgi:hypothetical protein
MKVSSNFLSWHYLLSSSQLIFVSLGCSAGGTLPLALLWLLVFLSLGRLISSGAAQCTLLQLAHISFALVMAYKHLPAHDSDVACVLDAPYTSAVAASPTIATSSGYPGRGRSRCLLVARRCSLHPPAGRKRPCTCWLLSLHAAAAAYAARACFVNQINCIRMLYASREALLLCSGSGYYSRCISLPPRLLKWG